MKGYSVFPKAPALLEHYHQIVKCHIKDTRWGWGLTPLQRCSRRILQPQLTGQEKEIQSDLPNVLKQSVSSVLCIYGGNWVNTMNFTFGFDNRKLSQQWRALLCPLKPSLLIAAPGRSRCFLFMDHFFDPRSSWKIFVQLFRNFFFLRIHHTFFWKYHMVCTSQPPKIWCQTSVQA